MFNKETNRVDELTFATHLTHLDSTAVAVTAVHLLIAAIFSYFSFGTAPPLAIIGWLVLWFSLSMWRLIYYTRVVPNRNIDLAKKRKSLLAINACFGLAQALSLVFFIYFTFTERVIYTMIVLATVTGSVTIIGVRSMFAVFSTPIMVSIAIVWLTIPYPGSSLLAQVIISLLSLLYFVILVADSQSFYDRLRDSTEFREKLRLSNIQLNKALLESKRASESKTRFLASASHDLRQPIHTMSMLNAALQMQKMDTPTMEIADRLGQAIDILAAQMDSLLDISKFDAGLIEADISTFDLNKFCSRLQTEYIEPCKAKGLAMDYLGSDQIALVNTDANLLERIVRNLLSNAIRYTDQGFIKLSLSSNDNNWRLEVGDTGKGMSKTEQLHIFDEFYQADNVNRDRAYGLGLGLAIAKRTAKVLNTEIQVDSEPGIGSVFGIELPKATKVTQLKIPNEAAIESSMQGLRVLFIDDELHIREAINIVLSKKGCAVMLAKNLTEAVEISKRQEIDIVISDLRLADDESGIDVIKLIREGNPNMPALLVSGDTAPSQLKLARKHGIKMLHKPLELSALEREIRYLIDG